jgi:hypothetical protein
MGYVVGKVGTGQVFLKELQFFLTNYDPTNAPYTSLISSWYKRPILGHITKGLSLTQFPQLKKATTHN